MSKTKLILISIASVIALGTLTACGEDDPVAVNLQPTKEQIKASEERNKPVTREELDKMMSDYYNQENPAKNLFKKQNQ